jgi:hypothetical protein
LLPFRQSVLKSQLYDQLQKTWSSGSFKFLKSIKKR